MRKRKTTAFGRDPQSGSPKDRTILVKGYCNSCQQPLGSGRGAQESQKSIGPSYRQANEDAINTSIHLRPKTFNNYDDNDLETEGTEIDDQYLFMGKI